MEEVMEIISLLNDEDKKNIRVCGDSFETGQVKKRDKTETGPGRKRGDSVS